MEETSWEMVSEHIKICISRDYRFGTDSFLLADFARVRGRDLCCDLGCGCGIIPLLWMRLPWPPQKIYGLDIQAKALELFRMSVKENNLQGKVYPLLGDLRRLPQSLPTGRLDLVSCNPPYQAEGTGLISREEHRLLIRHEKTASLEDVCTAAAKLLRFGGRFVLCQRPGRLSDVMAAMRKAGLEPKRLRFVQKCLNRAPWLFLIEGKRGAKPFMEVEPPLLIEGERGGFSAELMAIYKGRAF